MQDLIRLLVSFDQHLGYWINSSWTSPFFDTFFPFVTDLHHTWQFRYLLIPTFFVACIFNRRLSGLIIFFGLAVSMGLADFTGSFLKHFFQRQRPFEVSSDFVQRSPASGFAFPSNHAVNMFCMFFFLVTFFPKARWALFLIATIVAYSRIYNGVHFPSDVLAGALLGGFFGIAGSDLTQRAIHRVDLLFKGRSRG